MHQHKTTSAGQSNAVTGSAGKGGRTLPAVPMLQQRPKEDAAMQMQEDGSAPSAVIQMRPADWARLPAITNALQQPHGWFSTWKKIKAAIEEYKQLRENQYDRRDEKLNAITEMIGTWKEEHKDDTTDRVQGIRGILPNLEDAINDEHDEINFFVNTHMYATGDSQYTSKEREDVAFSVAKQGAKLIIVSDTPGLAGYIEYAINRTTIELKHFEAQPEGLGLGSVLMNEFALFASSMGIAAVNVQLPALSAMGAYEIFGGVPRAGTEGNFDTLKGRYEESMGVKTDEEHGEHIAEDHGDSTYDNFIKEEAMAIGKTKANKAKFENPELGDEDLEHISDEAQRAHIESNVRNVVNVKRVARLKALSPFLSYNIPALLEKTTGMVARKWNTE